MRINLNSAARILYLGHATLNGHWKRYCNQNQSSLFSYLEQFHSREELLDIGLLGFTFEQFKNALKFYAEIGRRDKHRDVEFLKTLTTLSDEKLKEHIIENSGRPNADLYNVSVQLPLDVKRKIKKQAIETDTPVKEIILNVIVSSFS